jgi:nucleoside diphosphate kinase
MKYEDNLGVVILKPDCFRRKLVDKIIHYILKCNYKIVEAKIINKINLNDFKLIYNDVMFTKKENILEYLSLGPLLVLALYSHSNKSINELNSIKGNVYDANNENTIRYIYNANNKLINLVHISENKYDNIKYIKYFFKTYNTIYYNINVVESLSIGVYTQFLIDYYTYIRNSDYNFYKTIYYLKIVLYYNLFELTNIELYYNNSINYIQIFKSFSSFRNKNECAKIFDCENSKDKIFLKSNISNTIQYELLLDIVDTDNYINNYKNIMSKLEEIDICLDDFERVLLSSTFQEWSS